MARPRRSNFHLPKYVTEIHGSYWYRPRGGKSVRLASADNLKEAMAKYEALTTTGSIMDTGLVFSLIGNVNKNAPRRKLPVEITADDILWMWERSRGCCELTGIKFESIKLGKHRRRPWMPSVDRIDAKRGYTPDNVRLVCSAVNYAMNEWGEEVLELVARAYLHHKSSAPPKYQPRPPDWEPPKRRRTRKPRRTDDRLKVKQEPLR